MLFASLMVQSDSREPIKMKKPCNWLTPTVTTAFILSMGVNSSAAEPASQQTDRRSVQSAEARAEAATDRLTEREENRQMPLPGQGYSHSSPLLDKAKDREAVKAHLNELEEEGKIKPK